MLVGALVVRLRRGRVLGARVLRFVGYGSGPTLRSWWLLRLESTVRDVQRAIL